MFPIIQNVLSVMCYRLVLLLSLIVMSPVSYSDQRNQAPSADEPKLQVVTTFSILADMVKQVGQEAVDVYSLVDWDEDAHVFQPSPNEVKKIANADLLVLNGLGFEGWLARLLSAAKYEGPTVESSKGVDLIHLKPKHNDHDDQYEHHHEHDGHLHKASVYDPHAWHSLNAAMVYIENIAQALIQIDPSKEGFYQANKQVYLERLKVLDQNIKFQLTGLSADKKQLVVPHNAFAYFARDYKVRIHSLQGVSTDSEASAADLAKIVRLIRALKIHAIFTENVSDKRLIRVVESETEAKIKGALVSGALSRKVAPTYLEMMEYNSRLIIDALTQN